MAMTDERLASLREVANQPHGMVHTAILSMLTELLDELERLRGEPDKLPLRVEALEGRVFRLAFRIEEWAATATRQSVLNRLSRLEERCAVIDEEKAALQRLCGKVELRAKRQQADAAPSEAVEDVMTKRDPRGDVACACGQPGFRLLIIGKDVGIHCEKCFRKVAIAFYEVKSGDIAGLFRDAEWAFKNV